MNIFDELYAFRTSEPFIRADIRKPARVVLTLSPRARVDLITDRRYHPGYGATPGPVHGLSWESVRQNEPWIAWIEYGPERRRFDRLAAGLLNVGTTEEQEKALRLLLTDHYRVEGRSATVRRVDEIFEVFVAQHAVEHYRDAIDEMLDCYAIPFAVAITDRNVLIGMAHSRHRHDGAMIERLDAAGGLVWSTRGLIPEAAQAHLFTFSP